MIRRYFRHLWESMKNLKRNGWMTFVAISSVSITLILVGIFSAVIANTERLATGIEKNIQVNAFLLVDSTDYVKQIPNQDGTLAPNENYHKIYDQIAALPEVQKIDFSDKEEQLKNLQETLGDSWEIFEGDANPLSTVYIITTTSPKAVKSVAEQIEGIEGIDSVEYGGANTERIFRIAGVIRTWGLVGAGLLLFVAVFLISNTIRITIISRRREIMIMRLVGAKNSYIRWPFFLEGAWVGLIGAILPSLILFYGYHFVYQKFNVALIKQNLSMYEPDIFLLYAMGALFLIGILIGSVGSVLSMRRYLKA
ncbi:permease-like cell division protein FtsX [Streptococcus zalophi]|uniref:Cell division protein FtsX n=1 Tax=Streptococcus zalophi TaxID=640031 RepID=A0A934P8Z2_9STRE|nr:permease-like cell division protein FtsX [Streptococcus zalophi]MBJ8349152.1 ABC transporter permease [Streptococcus zalophi]MCR8967696.1 permease-like cell division protein FtsX [Streptococcus zalophi]